jgi:D-glycero-alpha-D-manno-heptose-7-phosphate kinase
MIISKTPFRISFCGGGTDFREYYKKEGGAVFSSTIDKYMYITVNKFFDRDKIMLKYSKNELVNDVNKVKHPIIRECLKKVGISGGIEITSMADIPAATGLGSSSSFTVGLLNALYRYKGELITNDELAKQACEVEIDILNSPIGKQDQYAATYGGMNFFRFNQDETVDRVPVWHGSLFLDSCLKLFYTGIVRDSKKILSSQKSRTINNQKTLREMKALISPMKRALFYRDVDSFGRLLNRSWELKKSLAEGISNSLIDKYYHIAIKHGATGGKLLGAGGGGFLLFAVKEQKQLAVRNALKDLREVPFNIENSGSRIIHLED